MSQPEQTPTGRVREALIELQRYLADELAPLMVTDAVDLLIRCPPGVVASQIQGWVASQYRGRASGVAVSDYLYHAVKKLHEMGEYELVEQAVLDAFLAQLNQLVLQICPEEDRASLRENLQRIGETETTVTAPISTLHRLPGAPEEGDRKGSAVTIPDAAARDVRRLSLLVDRLERSPGVVGDVADLEGDSTELQARILAAAAVGSRSGREFERHMHRLSRLGVDTRMDRVFRWLGRSLPGWVLPPDASGGADGVSLPPSRPAEAMHRIISMAETPEEGATRFNEMVQAAIERFNQGALAQAAVMFDLAERVVAEKKLAPDVAKSIRSRAHQSLSSECLKEYADRTEKHAMLRRILAFFPALTVKGLLRDLNGESRRDRRRLILRLLEVHGSQARVAARELLTVAADEGGDGHGYFIRNLIYLLRRIPAPDEAPLDEETKLLARLTDWDRPPLVVREAVAALGGLAHPVAEQTLIRRLGEIEQKLLGEDEPPEGSDELLSLLDRVVSALARLGTPNAARVIAAHGLKKDPRLGRTPERLEELSALDLSRDPDLVNLLVDALERALPMKVLGMAVGKKSADIPYLIKALSGTPAPAVRRILEDIVRRFSELPFGEVASEVQAGFGTAARSDTEPSTALSGDVELFGLPNLIQTLADSRVSGTLSLFDQENDKVGVISMKAGQIVNCSVGALQGEAAFYQLFEKPVPGSFVFKSGVPSPRDPVLDVMSGLLEAMRRHDEFMEARALVPDGAALESTGEEPRPVPDEADPRLVREVWGRASSGVSPERCEAELPADSYRIRRLYAHWVETGSLRPAA